MLASPATECKHENWFIQAVSSFGPDLAGWGKIFAPLVCDWKKRNPREDYVRLGAQTVPLLRMHLLNTCHIKTEKENTPSNLGILTLISRVPLIIEFHYAQGFLYRVFPLTKPWPAAIHANILEQKKVFTYTYTNMAAVLFFGIPIWLPWRHLKTLYYQKTNPSVVLQKEQLWACVIRPANKAHEILVC